MIETIAPNLTLTTMLQPGEIISARYKLIKSLGNNLNRQTWLADDLTMVNSPPVVIKLLAFGGDVQWEDLKLFEREAQILRQLNHPKIPKYLDFFAIDERSLWFCLVQEYIPGVSFKELLNQGKRYTETEVRDIAKQVLEILLYLHKFNPPILHRDLKPSNLILGEDKQVYLVDFGAVQDRALKEGVTFTVVGTYGYTPLEQFGGRAVPASDLYALGTSLIHLLTAIPPADLPTRDLHLQFRQYVNISDNLISWLEKITEPALERRFSTAKEALKAIDSRGFISQAQKKNILKNPKVNRPINTQVMLENKLEKLIITIPAKINLKIINQLSFVIIFLCLFPIFLIGFLNTAIPLIFIFGLIAVGVLDYYLTSNELILRELGFTWRKKIFNLVIFSQQGLTNEITDLSINYLDVQEGLFTKVYKPKEIVITCQCSISQKFQRYNFGQGLSELELMWLVQEIRDWLKS